MVKLTHIVTSGIVAGALILSIASPAAAWHPKGVIKKEVQNQTTASALADAETATEAVATKPGDIVKYVITVSNIGEAANNGYNDMAKTVMTDELPAGVELVSNPTQRKITENIGLLKPGQKVTKEYLVKVTSTTDGAVIANEACFTGDSTANDNPQHDCNKAHIKVSVPTPPKTPEPPKDVPHILPSTGPEAIIGSAAGIGGLAYGVTAYARSRRNLRKVQ